MQPEIIIPLFKIGLVEGLLLAVLIFFLEVAIGAVFLHLATKLLGFDKSNFLSAFTIVLMISAVSIAGFFVYAVPILALVLALVLIIATIYLIKIVYDESWGKAILAWLLQYVLAFLVMIFLVGIIVAFVVALI